MPYVFCIPLVTGLIAATTALRARDRRLRRIGAAVVLLSYVVIAIGLLTLITPEPW
ncbi:hypothetical protein [Streptomyces sp. Midd1]|uniref:hypothetical protein n=1 Tax=Streptomyces sp. Midd3 TaxID=3161191 RepID=UPI0034DABD89